MSSDFAVFIPSNGRANNVVTYESLRHHGYTGDIFIVVDDQDGSIGEYRSKFGEQVIVFDKEEAYKITDTGNNFHDMRAVVFARNEIPNIAKRMGLKYFLVLDDDYTSFLWRYTEGNKLGSTECHNLDEMFVAMCRFLEVSGALTVTLAQGGDFIGGKEDMYRIVGSLHYDIRFLGSDYINKDWNGKDKEKELGKEIYFIGRSHGMSSSGLKKRIIEAQK